MDPMPLNDDHFMKEALKEAHKALAKDEVPVGAVIVCDKTIIARAFNMTETLNDPTAHAEMQAFTAASNYLGGKYLTDCILYVTLEPCLMCAGASYWTRIKKIVYGAGDPKRGYTVTGGDPLHPRTTVVSGVQEKECSGLLEDFFKSKRK